MAGSLAYNGRDPTHAVSMVAIWQANLRDVAKVTFIQFADVIGGTGRLSTLYVEFDGMKLPAMFCRWAVYSCAGDVALMRQSAAHLQQETGTLGYHGRLNAAFPAHASQSFSRCGYRWSCGQFRCNCNMKLHSQDVDWLLCRSSCAGRAAIGLNRQTHSPDGARRPGNCASHAVRCAHMLHTARPGELHPIP